jgi:hypothetical protein
MLILRLKDFYVSINNQKPNVKEQDGAAEKVQGLEKWGTVDVLGQPAEPICTYYRCHHNE